MALDTQALEDPPARRAATVLRAPDRWRASVVLGDNLSMITLETLRREKKAEILRLAQEYGARNVRVFGSIARGDSREDSDIDFLVDLEEGRTLFDLGGLLMDLRDLLGARVDLITTRTLSRYIRDRVLAQAVLL